MDKSQLASIFGMSTDALELKTKYVFISARSFTGNGSSGTSRLYLNMMLYNPFRVVGVGGQVILAGASTVAEKYSFGILGHNISTASNYFGTFTQDATANKELEIGDVLFRSFDQGVPLPEFDDFENGGTHTYSVEGNRLGKWQHNQLGVLTCTKEHVVSSTGVLFPFLIVEVA